MKEVPTYVAPFIVGVMAARGLALHRQGFGGKGLTDDTVDVARRMVDDRPLTLEEVATIRNWFRRFSVNRRFVQSRTKNPQSPAAVTWYLHGADPGFEWATKVIDEDGFTREKKRGRGQ